MSKDVKPKQRLGHVHSKRRRIIIWSLVAAACGGGTYAVYHFTGTTEV